MPSSAYLARTHRFNVFRPALLRDLQPAAQVDRWQHRQTIRHHVRQDRSPPDCRQSTMHPENPFLVDRGVRLVAERHCTSGTDRVADQMNA